MINDSFCKSTKILLITLRKGEYIRNLDKCMKLVLREILK